MSTVRYTCPQLTQANHSDWLTNCETHKAISHSKYGDEFMKVSYYIGCTVVDHVTRKMYNISL